MGRRRGGDGKEERGEEGEIGRRRGGRGRDGERGRDGKEERGEEGEIGRRRGGRGRDGERGRDGKEERGEEGERQIRYLFYIRLRDEGRGQQLQINVTILHGEGYSLRGYRSNIRQER